MDTEEGKSRMVSEIYIYTLCYAFPKMNADESLLQAQGTVLSALWCHSGLPRKRVMHMLANSLPFEEANTTL